MQHTKKKKANRLIHEQSPYLLQHAYNPVDWYPWGELAVEKAKNEDKPIFLSIGYSTCHWCHVMERESFEDDEVAAVLNRVFVCVKVDREERPDIDSIYMTACQAMTGSGGWPLTILITPDRRPFFAGTYLPKKAHFGRMGLLELTERVELLWQTAREDVEQTADSVIAGLQAANSVNPGESLDEDVLHLAYEQLATRYDPEYGGFGRAPKFPMPHNLTFLLRYWQRTGKPEALEMVENTLAQMSQGGVYDHLGFGFHRYSTDREWLLPHFEKMLYDQALLAIACLEAYQASGRSSFAQIAEEIFAYVLRDMTDPEGGYYSAEDADSEGEEGRFYVWSADEIQAVLGKEDAALFGKAYHIRSEGNFLDEATRRPTGKNILHLATTLPSLAASFGMDDSKLTEKLREMKEKLFLARKNRVPPYKDDKVLTDWNGLMIAALAAGGRVLERGIFTSAAQKAAEFILTRLKKDGRLLKRYRQGQAALPAHLDDYAFMVWGLLELYETTFDPHYLKEALALNQTQVERFFDDSSGSFFFTADDTEEVLIRQREFYDGAIPSGNSIAAMNNLRLARLTGNMEPEETALGIFRACAGELRRHPAAYTQMLAALSFALGPSLEVVIAGDQAATDTREMLKVLHSRFIPNMVVLLRPAGEQGIELVKLAPFCAAMPAIDGKATAYVCRNHSCLTPIIEAAQLPTLLSG
ncbi:MAG: hypothetical protein DDT21_01112 [Syntrophomonadaceae bacterium]|nr:hypothetical protein [Bacillota bacterium]